MKEILKYIANPIIFAMAEPASVTRHLINTLELNLKVVEVTTTPDSDINKVPFKKLMIYTA
jgi:hypothetical protein